MNMVELMSKGRIVELNNIIAEGDPARRLEMRRRTVFTGEYMYEVDTISHIGAHAEAPSHFIPALDESMPAKDISEFGPETFMGEAVFVDLKDLNIGDAITMEFIEQFNIKKGDIVIMGNAPTTGEVGAPVVPASGSGMIVAAERPVKVKMTAEVAKFLGETGIKCMGLDWSFQLEPGFENLAAMRLHVELLSRDIPLIEGLCDLDKLTERRFYFIGLPYRVKGCDSWPVRAIAIEGVL